MQPPEPPQVGAEDGVTGVGAPEPVGEPAQYSTVQCSTVQYSRGTCPGYTPGSAGPGPPPRGRQPHHLEVKI